MGIEAEKTMDELQTSIASYKPSEYVEAVWPRIGEVGAEASFTPLVLSRIPGPPKSVDRMFSDFDSSEAQESEQESTSTLDEQNIAVREAKEVANTKVAPPSFVDPRAEEEVGAAQPDVAPSGDELAVEAHNDSSDEPEADRLANDPDSGVSIDEEEQSKLIAQAAEKAYAQGREDARAEIDDMKAQLEKQFSTVVEDLRLQLSEGLHSCERNAVELALQVARKLVGEVVESKRDYVVGIIQDALKSIAGTEVTGVRVSPQDYEYLSQHKDELGGQLKSSGMWELQSDDSIRAGCIVTTSAGEVDFDLDKAWSRMREKVLKGPQS